MLAHDEFDARVLARRLDYKAPAGLSRSSGLGGSAGFGGSYSCGGRRGAEGGRERQFA